MRETEPIPFFVVDRPKSLELLEFCGINTQSFKIGLMGNSNTSKNFQKLFRDFKGDNIIKMADSGVFTKDGNTSKNYEDLFETYEYMRVHYGIIIDVIKNKNKTIQSAKKAVKTYNKGKYSFKLVGVVQGKSVGEYLNCYTSLKKLGFKYIAIGGLLKKVQNSSRYVKVRDENFLENVVKAIRERYENDWLFLLGSYHPKRHQLFAKYNIFGADFKGWILNYKAPNQQLAMLEKKATLLERQLLIRRSDLKHLKISLAKLRKGSNIEGIQSAEEALLKLRLSIAKKQNNGEYLQVMSKMDELQTTSEDDFRTDRFKQIKNYITKNVYGKILPKRLLIVSCSQRKRIFLNAAPSLEVYDGPMFRMLRKSNALNNGVDVRIISARYGVLPPTKTIEYYDLKMTPEIANSVNEEIIQSLEDVLSNDKYKEIFVCMGQVYRDSIHGIEKIVPPECDLIIARGRIGEQLKAVKDWLSASET